MSRISRRWPARQASFRLSGWETGPPSTRLGAQAPVAAAGADEGAHGALPGPAHAQGPVGKDLNGDGTAGADAGHAVPVQLPAQDHTAHAQIRRTLHAGEGVDRHLGGAVEGQVREHGPSQGRQTPVLDNHTVYAAAGGQAQHVRRRCQLPVRGEGVQGQIHFYAADVAVVHRLGQLFGGEVLRAAAGVEFAAAQVDGIRPVLNGGHHGLPVAGGR